MSINSNKNSPTRPSKDISDGYSVASISASLNNNNTSVRQTDVVEETFLSPIEQAILRSNVPIELNETEEISALGVNGIWANKTENINWESYYRISDYSINEDMNPQIIKKKVSQNLEYVQELAFRYLKPPTPPLPGDIIIKQEQSILTPPAPPLIIRQQPPRPSTPEPLIIREHPPEYPAAIGQKIITISGKKLPPPPRKVVIERLAQLPVKPQSVIIERWLPYNSGQKRRVIYERPKPEPEFTKPRNVIIQWESPNVSIKQEVKHLDIIRADPNEYYQRFGSNLTHHTELPDYVRNIKPPNGIKLAADYHKQFYELEGDVEALNLIDLDKEGLSEYKSQLNIILSRKNSLSTKSTSDTSKSSHFSIYEQITNEVDVREDDEISMSEAERIFSRLNEKSQQKKTIKRKDLLKFLESNLIDDEKVDLNQYRDAFTKFTKL